MRRCILVKSESFGEGDCFSKRWMGMVERKREKDDGLRALRRRAEGVYEQQRLGSPPGGHHRLRGSRLLIGSACAARNMCYRPPLEAALAA